MGEEVPATADPVQTAAEAASDRGESGQSGEQAYDPRRTAFVTMLGKGLIEAVETAGAYGGGVFVRSHDRRTLVLAVVIGMPRSLLRAWWRIPVSGRLPAAETYRTGRGVQLADAGETMRRFPQFAAAMPYSFCYASAPVRFNGEPIAGLFVMRTVRDSDQGLAAEYTRLQETVDRLSASLTGMDEEVVEYDGEPFGIRMPSAPTGRVGLFDWDLRTGDFEADPDTCAVIGADPGSFDGTVADVASRMVPDDRCELWACARAPDGAEQIRARKLRVQDSGDRIKPIELWGRYTQTGDGGPHLLGALVDASEGTVVAEAAERLPDGLFALDHDGRISYVNSTAERLLRRERGELLGRSLWDSLPWLSDPSYEDRYRAAVVSQEATSFKVRHPDGQWLAFVLHPDPTGLTGRVVPAGPPESGAETPAARPVSLEAGTMTPPVAAARAGSLHHVVHMASGLTEAVTVREVCTVVAEQLLPAFGGQEVRLYLADGGKLRAAYAFADATPGAVDALPELPLDAPLPTVEAFTSGTPVFVRTPAHLATSYPEATADRMHSWAFIPLVASGNPVGTCAFGYASPHTFATDERAALTALGGLVAQALERARLYDAEFTLARGLQNALLPRRLPVIDGLRSAGRYLPGTQGMDIGGDWYDVIETERGVVLVIGEVEGHSVAAAAVMGQLRSAVTALAASGSPPDEVISRTNRLLAHLDPGVCATCCYVLLEPETGRAQVVRAGHPPPLLRGPSGQTEVLNLAGGTLLGVDPCMVFPVTELQLLPGSVLVLYTDGLVEQPGQDIDSGIDAIRSFLTGFPPVSLEYLSDRLVQQARRATDRPDDLALLLAEYDGVAGAGERVSRPPPA